MKKVYDALYGVSPTARNVGRVSDMIIGLAPPAPGKAGTPGALSLNVKSEESLTKKAMKLAPAVVGGVVGYLVGKRYKHAVLGTIAGAAAIETGYEFFKGDKKRATAWAIVEGAAIAGAVYMKRHAVRGYALGAAAGLVGTYFIEGSPAKAALAKLKA
jgi:hypothetical protein